jgi:hypothetical protein
MGHAERFRQISIRIVLLLGAAAIALGGCIASVKYPADWAAIRVSECADLSGAYENRGVVHSPTQMWSGPFEVTNTWLAQLFFNGQGRTLSDPKRPAYVQIDARTPGLLGITATMPDGKAVPITLHQDKDEFRCREGNIELSSSELGVNFVIVGGATTTFRLYRATDGALIVSGHSQLVGTAMIVVPLYGSSRTYARFAPAPEAAVLPATPAGTK